MDGGFREAELGDVFDRNGVTEPVLVCESTYSFVVMGLVLPANLETARIVRA